MHCLKKSGRQSFAISEILIFVSHCSANFQPILDCFIPNFKLKYEDLESIKADRVNTVAFNLHQIKRRAFFLLGQPVDDSSECLHFNRNFQDFKEHNINVFYDFNLQRTMVKLYNIQTPPGLLSFA